MDCTCESRYIDESPFICSPFSDEKSYLGLVTCNNRVFIGGLDLTREEGAVGIDHPMVYLEMPDNNSQGQMTLKVGVQKMYQGLPMPDNMWFRIDALMMLYSAVERHVCTLIPV